MNDLTLPIQATPANDSQLVKVRPAGHEPKSARRLADTKNLSHQEWLAVRNTGIGGSDAAAACGLNPYIVKPIL